MKAIAKTKTKKPLPQLVFMPRTLPSIYVYIMCMHVFMFLILSTNLYFKNVPPI